MPHRMAILEKPLLNISVIGHVDSGKPTLTGRLATKFSKFLGERDLKKLQSIADENSKGSFALAYFTDKTDVERKRGVTINQTLVEMETDTYIINFVDCPGHSDYAKNAANGTKQTDVSILCCPVDFESATGETGTLSTHIALCAFLAKKKFIICITKVDELSENLRKERFDAAVAAVLKL